MQEAAISNRTDTVAVERFTASDLSGLREELLQSGLDSRHVAELIRGFLAERGYGVSHDEARHAATRVEIFYGPLQRMQETLERLAICM